MSAKLEFKGNDIEEAINKACAKFSVSREKLNIKIISTGSTGIFGLCKKKAVIQASQKEQPKRNSRQTQSDSTNIPAPEKQKNKEKKGRKSRVAASDIETEKSIVDREKVKSPSRQQVALPSPEVVDYLKNNLRRLLELMGFSAEIAVSEKEGKSFLQISSDYNEKLTSKDGLLLDNLQYILRKMISVHFPQKVLFSIDADNFREKRRTILIEQARKLAIEAKETEKTKTIPPLNPAERRIVHMALQNDTTIRSRSVGDGLFKKILIYIPGKEKKRSSRRQRGKKVPHNKKSSSDN